MYFCSFVTKPIKHESKIHSNVFNSLYRTVTHEESYRIIYKEILLSMVTQFFRILTSRIRIPPKRCMSFNGPQPFPPHPPGDTWTQSLITNFLSFNSPQYETNHHKQDLLITSSKISDACSKLKSHKIFSLRSAWTSTEPPLVQS